MHEMEWKSVLVKHLVESAEDERWVGAEPGVHRRGEQ